ncbi:hypothetical protein [Saccharibacillus deserti]|uniref:hypothetical protein n=1 Tax=Saccharibacillus deserti TaxID=1634444 RepID=UPI001555625D|nr:hypothetical protein [Saccharibacillus deserti]
MIKNFTKEALLSGKDVLMEIEGNCMVPLILGGEKVLIRSIKSNEKLRIGDVVLFEDEVLNNLVLHRINYIYEDFIVTSGDNNPFFDPIINKRKIIGKIKFSNKNTEQDSSNIIYVINSSLKKTKKQNFYYTDCPNEMIDKMKALNYSIVVLHNQAKVHLFECDLSKFNKIAYFFGYEFNDELDNHISKNKVDAVLRTEIFPSTTDLVEQIKSIDFLHTKYNTLPFLHSD